MQEGDQEEEPLPLFYQGTFTETSCVESLVAYHSKGITDRIPEEILGIDRELLEGSSRCEESSSRPCWTSLGQRSQPSAATVERLRTKVIAGKAPLHSTLWQNQEIYTLQQGEDVERKDRRPRCLQRKGHCQDSRESVRCTTIKWLD